MATALTGSNQPVSLGNGYAVRSPGLRGSAELRQPGPAGATLGRSPAASVGAAALDAALAAAHVTEVRQIELTLQPPDARAAPGMLRSVQGETALELQVPDLGPDTGQWVLSVDDAGALRWHLPEDDVQTVQPPSVRGAGNVKRFRIPAVLPAPAPGSTQTQRSIFGAVAKRLLKVLVYPVTDPVLGPVGAFFAERWEQAKRPYGLRSFTPQNFRDPQVPALSANELSAMAMGGPTLLFIHGTFSTAHAGFGDLPDATLAALHRRYAGRVFAFNHHTLSHDPTRNVAWLLSQLPADALQLDIVCHSRGGLVARTLAERPAAFGLAAAHVTVRRTVFVGVPNSGTALTDPDHMVDMIDRLTTALTLAPTGPVTETLEGLITTLKVIGHAALKGLGGLASMNPHGEFLAALNASSQSPPDYFAVASNYQPIDHGLRALVSGAVDSVADQIFGQAGNDLVVPTDGVYGSNGHAGFPLPAERLLLLPPADGVMHTAMFGHPSVSEKLTGWLT